ncbi:hypothetical protein [Klebsiella sp. 2680]|uniref:hypothetical protein n=1 Tax=Klebsiella sp. 2680 TaxID=2018037 RepID=UPI00115B4BD4|nr:hypothetical protein [Klebsiella sp. 2680]
MSKETGGQAFPRQQWEYDGQNNVLQYQEEGMTLRDFFAAKAMEAIVRRYDGHSFGGGPNSPYYKELAEDAYNIADAMLKAREAS